ncbi:MAG: hypothetical protein B5766_11775 [Candidatus Lumbricidophila eiseniae]|uniref:ABC transporter domain-containing protein n=1 Tax=Candidatus Lumbricidiphila eiseniae TaxID=1969409 RepID=A0A2A6FNS0_9MICO|nr:MAG: hypothetical protein B5766_11775 [Candidatus Lumbricidophila eiseniae]
MLNCTVGLVFNHSAQRFSLSSIVVEHLTALADIYGVGKPRSEYLIETLDLVPHAKTRTEKLSGGERQCLAITSALVHKSRVLLLDEPTAGLDPTTRHSVVEMLRSDKFSYMTTLYTTHYLEEASRLCDTVSILSFGVILANPLPSVTAVTMLFPIARKTTRWS